MQKNEIIIPKLNYETIESMIYTIRGQKVMLDYDLAKIYGYSTKAFNQQVRNNIDKFPERYRFQLTNEEVLNNLRSNFLTSSWGGARYLPYAFTEQGIYMLMTVLKGELATKQSIMLIDTFKEMKDYIVENNNILTNTNSYIESKFSSYDKRFENVEEKLEIVMDNFIDSSTYKHFLIKNGEKLEADVAYQEIYKLARVSIYIIDDYIDVKTLQLLKVCKVNINIIIITDNKAKNNINKSFINDFIHDTNFNITFIKNNDLFHDRYVVIDYNSNDYKLFHCGHSSKDAGRSVNTIVELEEKEVYKVLIDKALNHNILNIK